MALDVIKVRGARQHNLKNIDLEIPRDKYVVITGISGSGKSSLAFDTIYAEGQRRYVESLSAYARQFLGQMDKPDVDYIEGLSPAVSIDQKSRTKNPRSTVGTITEIYDYMRLLFARVGHPHCTKCGKEVTRQSTEQIVDTILGQPEGQRIQILAPVVKGRKGEYRKVLEEIKKEGFVRVRIDGEVRELTDESVLQGRLDRYKQHTIDVVVDRLITKPGVRNRLADSIETALKMGKGTVAVEILGDAEPQGDGKARRARRSREMLFSEHLACATCGIGIEEVAPRNFSFNSPYGACEECHGLGYHTVVDPELIVPDGSLSIREGAIAPFAHTQSQYIHAVWRALSDEYGVDLDAPFCTLSEEQMSYVLEGTPDKIWVSFYDRDGDKRSFRMAWRGVISLLERQMTDSSSDMIREEASAYTSKLPCRKCKGLRLKPESLAVTIKAKHNSRASGGDGKPGRRASGARVREHNVSQVASLSIKDAFDWFGSVVLTEREETIARQVLKEIKARLGFLNAVGLDYLTIDRAAATLAGGESQRIRLATQIGSGLMGVLYILDEPSVGLHQRDNRRLIDTLKRLRDLGNTILVVEHDEETIRSADHIIDIGPGAGEHGGRVVAQGSVEDIAGEPRSITGDYLARRREIPIPEKRRGGNGDSVELKGAQHHNLKKIDVRIPLGCFVCVTGVSGSGKSTLVQETLYPRLLFDLYGTRGVWGKHKGISGLEHIDKVVDIDQSPIGRTPRSNPATYTKTFDHIREIFSQTAEARMRGYQPGRFSFNVKGGRCEACRGDGIIKIEMQFLPDVYVPCEVCKGKRYNRETLEVTFKGRNIADVLDMTVEEAVRFFENVPRIRRKLQTLHDVGLDYIKLGQPATTLSGGEAQRVKLSSELSRKGTGSTLYILDEPTTGLHFADIEKLLGVLGRLVDAGNTVVVIEHNLDVIKTADHIIDLGPEGGDEGGFVVATGTPEEVSKVRGSYTGRFLRTVLGRRSGRARGTADQAGEGVAAAAGS